VSGPAPAAAPITRYGNVIRLRPERREEYLSLHAAVWPAVEQALRDGNIQNYTIFLHGDLLFGYFEYHGEDFAADQRKIAADPQTQRWWQLTDPCQERLPDVPPGQQWSPATPVWHLD
jgi:L-rhamnose mutarotase